MNGMAWFHGDPVDHDGWHDSGARGWAWKDVQPVFRAIERSDIGDPEWHGSAGPMRVTRPRDVTALPLSFVAAGAELGFPVVEDFNGARLDQSLMRRLGAEMLVVRPDQVISAVWPVPG